jgi:hypothetical protein
VSAFLAQDVQDDAAMPAGSDDDHLHGAPFS